MVVSNREPYLHQTAEDGAIVTVRPPVGYRLRSMRSYGSAAGPALTAEGNGFGLVASPVRNPEMHVDQAFQTLIERRARRHLLLLFDFDGTLCPFSPDPDAVHLTPAVSALLGSLACKPASTVGIISGRRLPDLHKRARVAREIYLAGFHGLEIETPGEAFMHPDAAEATPLMRAIADAMQPCLGHLPGVFIEDKVFSIALHYREADDEVRVTAQDQFMSIARDHLDAGRVRALPGACVIELLPGVTWNKGRALEWIRERVEALHGPTFSVYVGDDVTDEDAFRAVGPHGVTIAASDRAAGAQFRVDGPESVRRLLQLIDAALA